MSLAAVKRKKLPTFADEMLAILPALIARHPEGVGLGPFCEALSADGPTVRNGMIRLATEGRADLRRRVARGGEWIVVPWRYRDPRADGKRYCPGCGEFFDLRPRVKAKQYTAYDDRHCCSRKCGVAWSWTRPGVKDKRKAGIQAERKTPAAKRRIEAHNRRRWSDPAQHQRLSEWNRRRWSDPKTKAELSRAIAAVQRTPEMRALYSNLRKEWWQDPVMRRKMVEAMKKSRASPESKAMFSQMMKDRWQDPVLRPKYLAAVRRNSQKAVDSVRGTKQSAAHVAKRVKSTRRTKARRRAGVAPRRKSRR